MTAEDGEREPTVTVHAGDCLDVLASYPADHFAAVVCDPPYGLDFMGREWDHGVPGEPFWRAIARTMKPGAYLVAFGGTRTSHRLTCAIEDAGLEIRDSLMWLYGSGFPKSLDVSKALDKQRHDRAEVLEVTAWIREARDTHDVSNAAIDAEFGFTGMAGHWTSVASQPAVPTLDQWPRLLAVLGVSPDDVPARVRYLAEELNGRKGEFGAAWHDRPVTGAFTDQDPGGPTWTLTSRDGLRRDIPASEAASRWRGWGTALKPAWEPIILARKPLAGTVAVNVTAYGTGALNIDATRIGMRDERDLNRAGSIGYGGSEPQGVVRDGGAGRWPANVILTHSTECVEVGTRRVKGSRIDTACESDAMQAFAGEGLGGARGPRGIGDADGMETVPAWECVPECPVRILDEQTGELTSGRLQSHHKRSGGSAIGTFAIRDRTGEPANYGGDSGGASRFFYTAKANRAERDAGLLGEPDRVLQTHGETGPAAGKPNGQGPITAKNYHPTVKPIDVMRWLVRLITPGRGPVLDPFAGSGTTGCAAALEWCDSVLIDLDAGHADLCRARAAHWIEEAVAERKAYQAPLGAPTLTPPPRPAVAPIVAHDVQPSLFDE